MKRKNVSLKGKLGLNKEILTSLNVQQQSAAAGGVSARTYKECLTKRHCSNQPPQAGSDA